MRLKKRSNEALMQARAHRWSKSLVNKICNAMLDYVTIHAVPCTDLEDVFEL
jgi:hypothetical protein